VPQPRPGWGRFWLGVLAGGCGVIVVEAVALLVAFVVLGAAIGSAVRHATGGTSIPGLPGGLPAGLPQITTSSDPCSPQPCAAHGGVTVLVANVNRSAGPAAGGHLVELDVTFVGDAGTHTVTPAEVLLHDAAGNVVVPGTPAAGCAAAADAVNVQAGQRQGPFRECYAVSGSTGGGLTLVWVDPEDLAVIEVPLPGG
jgi:hypothetical protein